MPDRSGWKTQRRSRGRYWPVAMLLLVAAVLYVSGWHRQLSLHALPDHQRMLVALIADRPVLAAAAYVALYAGAIALALPIGPVLTMTGGALFGTWIGAVLAALGATAGAALLFLVVRAALAPLFTRRAGRLMEQVRLGLERDGFWYLLSLRLLPIVPYWLGTAAPAVFGMRLWPFVTATGIGILPGTVVFASLGTGIAGALARGGRPEEPAFLTPSVLLPLLALALLSLFTAWWRRRRRTA